MTKTAALLFTVLLASLSGSQADAGLRRRCRRLCRPEVTRCVAAGFTRASCTQVLRSDCVARGGYCLFVPPTTTTTTTAPPPTTTTTLPAGPDYSVYSGSWGYAAGFQNYSVCATLFPTQLNGTLQLSVSPPGGIVGSVDSSIAIAGSFTSLLSASISSQVYTDVWGCASTFDADVTSFTTTQGVLQAYIYQQCPGGPVCADYYVGAVAR